MMRIAQIFSQPKKWKFRNLIAKIALVLCRFFFFFFMSCSRLGKFRREFVSVLDRCRCNNREIHRHYSCYFNAPGTRLNAIRPNARLCHFVNHRERSKSYREKNVSNEFWNEKCKRTKPQFHRVSCFFSTFHFMKTKKTKQKKNIQIPTNYTNFINFVNATQRTTRPGTDRADVFYRKCMWYLSR